MGCPVDKDLMKLISVEVCNLEKEVDNLKQSSVDEANKISAALQIIRDEIDNFDKRITEIDRKVEAERKERLEKEESLSDAIADISSNVAEVDKRIDANEGDISLLKEKQSDLETTVSFVTDEQARLTADIGALKKEQSQLDARVDALEKGSSKTTNAKIFQVPSRNRCFCGRDRELEAIVAQLKNTPNGCIHSAICGLGGVGKTSLAVEFLWRNDKEYPGGIFWICGENNNLFQRTVGEMARQIGTSENDFDKSLSRTLDWLGKRDDLWCLVVDNLDELEMSTEMRKLLTGHWKYMARGHIIITTRREVSEIEEETGIDEKCCIDLKCLTEEEGIQFLRLRTGKDQGEDDDLRQLVRELGGLPLALDQAGAYIRWVKQSIKEYMEKYKKQRLQLLEKRKAQQFVENTPPERLAVHTTWLLNFDHIRQISEEMGIGRAPILFMQVCAFYGPDDIPCELVNEALKEEDSSEGSGPCDQVEIVSLLTKFSLFQRYGTDSFSVHRLVQEVIRNRLEKEQTEFSILSLALRVLHRALKDTRSPAEVCESFVEDAVFSVENPPSLHLWGKLASHATYLLEHLSHFSVKQEAAGHKLLYTEEAVRVFNEAGIFFSVSQEKIKAQEVQKYKLEFLVKLQKPTEENSAKLPNYFIDIPLKDRNRKLISHCMRQMASEGDFVDESDSVREEREKKANQLREEGNFAVKDKEFKEALTFYSNAIGLTANDYRLFANRAFCYLKLGKPQQSLDDCEKCLLLNPGYSKALSRKAWALEDLVKGGSSHLMGQKRAAVAVAVHFDPDFRQDKKFCKMFPEVDTHSSKEISNSAQLAFALMTTQGSETLLLHDGEYNLPQFVALTDLQIVGLGQEVVFNCKEEFTISNARCYFEKVRFSKGSVGLVCQFNSTIHLKLCEISGGYSSCEDFPECNGGPGCVAASLGKPACDRTGKFGQSGIKSGVGGFPGVSIAFQSSALIEDCAIHDCGGSGALVRAFSRMEVRKCEIYKNHQACLEARLGGKLVAYENRIYSSNFHGILIGPNAGECDIRGNKIFENAREGILAQSNEKTIRIHENDIHHNGPFGLSLDENSHLEISNNKIFDNGFWGILAKSRTSANITENVLFANKCGGIFIDVNYSGRIYLESNIVRDHSGPWLEYQTFPKEVPLDNSRESAFHELPHGERQFYSMPPILIRNKEFNNEEGMHYPKEVIERFNSGCTFCHLTKGVVPRLRKCPTCHIASYCSKECQRKHWPMHKTLCIALRSRYSVTLKVSSYVPMDRKVIQFRQFGTHLKGIGTGPKPSRNRRQKFIVKIQTGTLNSHPLQLLRVYDKSLTLDGDIQSPEIFSVIMECGVLGELNKFTSKKAFFWAMFTENGERLTVLLDQLAPYQKW